MENMNRAIIMAGHVMLFIVAVSIGVFLYSTLINTQDSILTSSEYYSREAEHLTTDTDYSRVVSRGEAIALILSLLDDNSYVANYVNVGTSTFKNDTSGDKNAIKQANLYGAVIENGYDMSYNFNGDKVGIVLKKHGE